MRHAFGQHGHSRLGVVARGTASDAHTPHFKTPVPVILPSFRTTVVQTFIIACCNLAFSGGFALQLGALSNSTWAILNVPSALPGDSQQVR